MNSPLKVGKGMVGGLMGCWTMIGPDVETVEEDKDLPDAGDTPDEVTAISICCIFCCILSTLAAVQCCCMCHRHLELMKTDQTSLSVPEEV